MFEKRVFDMKELYIDKVMQTKATQIRNFILANANQIKSVLEKLENTINESSINWKKVMIEDYFDVTNLQGLDLDYHDK